MTVRIDHLSDARVPLQSPFNKFSFLLSADSLVLVDGSSLEYNNWPGKAPGSKQLMAAACVTMRGVDGVWHLSRCTERLGFICKTILSKLNLLLASEAFLHRAVQVMNHMTVGK